MNLRSARPADFGAIFTLQRAAFVDEARLYETPFVPALDETLNALRDRLHDSQNWVLDDGGRVIAAVSLRNYRDGGPDVERLMVAPDRRGQGLARQLLQQAEIQARADGHDQIQLIVGELATTNRSMYLHLGWTERHRERLAGFDHVVLCTMTKAL